MAPVAQQKASTIRFSHALSAVAAILQSHPVILHKGLSVSDSSSRMLVGENPEGKCEEEACKDCPLDDEGSLF